MANSTLVLPLELLPDVPQIHWVADVNYILQVLFRNDHNDTIFDLREIENRCEPGNVVRQFFQFALIPAAIIVLFFSFTQKRQTFFPDAFDGRPGLAYPMDIFTRRGRISYSCAFGCTVYVVYKVVFERFYAYSIGTALYERPLATVASTLIYGTVYIPIFICITIGTVHGYGIGSLYLWALTGMEMGSLFGCDISAEDRLVLLAKRLPELVCLVYLCLRLPWKFVMSWRERHFTVGSMDLLESNSCYSEIKETYYGKRVMNLLRRKRKDSAPEKIPPFHKLMSVVYTWEEDFQFSSRLVTTQLVGAILLYQIAFEVLAFSISLLDSWLQTLRRQRSVVEEVNSISPTNATQRIENVYDVAVSGMLVFRVAAIISIVLAFVLGLTNIIRSFSGYRRYLKMIFQGDHSKFIKRGRQVPNQNLLAGCMRYAGYQVGYISWGFIIQTFVFCIVSALITALVLVFMYEGSGWFVDLLNFGWPVAMIGIIVNFSQILMARFLFLQDRGNTLALTNRRMFFITTYFIFFYNIFMGVFSCLVRVVESLIFGVYLMPRLDHCVLPPSFRATDPGYQAFIGFLKTESQHSHPVVLFFVHMMEIDVRRRRGQLEKVGLIVTTNQNLDHVISEEDTNIQLTHFDIGKDEEDNQRKEGLIKFRWQLALTLLNNPSVRMMRKGFMQAQDKAKALGLMLPISDGILSADADEIREQTKTYLAEQEAEKEKNKRRCRTRKSSANDGSGDGAAGDVYMVDEEAVDDNGLAINVNDDDAVEKQESVIEVQEKSPDQQIKC